MALHEIVNMKFLGNLLYSRLKPNFYTNFHLLFNLLREWTFKNLFLVLTYVIQKIPQVIGYWVSCLISKNEGCAKCIGVVGQSLSNLAVSGFHFFNEAPAINFGFN